ncbi:MAG: DUF1365 domain-containing protein [Oleiphilaceae bacterium]|nr:DUF1365 domain-containing protein [Oleiphilaceae bacterium]
MSKQGIRHSAVYRGWVRHRRFVPKAHAFTYPLLMWYLDLDEVAAVMAQRWYTSLERFNLLSFRRADYYAPDQGDLKQAVIARVEQEHPDLNGQITRVCLLTHIRYAGYLFNPVSFYYCFDHNDQLCAILAEITNTPWGERHAYCLLAQGQAGRHVAFEFDKAFHVSPFNPMNMHYRWVFSQPAAHVRVHMDNLLQSADKTKHFDATLVLERQALEQVSSSLLIRHPLETVKVTSGIYWQAFRLWLKGVPFYDHPKHANKQAMTQVGQEHKG